MGDIERHPSFSFNSQSQMTYKSDDIAETENENLDQWKLSALESEQEIPISPKSTKKSKAPIPMSFKTENQSQTESSSASLVRKSRTPSPNSNKTLDDIVLISEVIDTLTEMKEPNGKTYFVDEIRTVPFVGSAQDDSEQKTAIEYLDDVLKKEEVNDDNLRAKADESGISTSVVAVVHLNDVAEEEPVVNVKTYFDLEEKTSIGDTIAEEIVTLAGSDTDVQEGNNDSTVAQNDFSQESETAVSELPASESMENITSENESNSETAVTDVSPPESIEINTNDIQSNTETAVTDVSASESIQSNKSEKQSIVENLHVVNQEEVEDMEKRSLIDDKQDDTNSSTSEEPMTFKERLAKLLGQQPVAEVRRVSPRATDQPLQNPPEPKLKHSKSEPDIFNSMVMQGVFKDIRSKYEQNEPDASKKPMQMTVTDDIDIDNSNANVPAPPKFDPFIYKTIGTRQNPRMALKIGNDNEYESSKKPPLTAPIIMDNDHGTVILREKSSEEDDQTRMISIKDRLENIFKRGPPDRFSRPKSIVSVAATIDDASVPTVVNSTRIDNDKIDEDDEEVIRIKDSKRPFDTVHKQKLLFNDVLRSIGVETRPSIIRASSITKLRRKPATIEDARNALKHVSSDWKKNVN